MSDPTSPVPAVPVPEEERPDEACLGCDGYGCVVVKSTIPTADMTATCEVCGGTGTEPPTPPAPVVGEGERAGRWLDQTILHDPEQPDVMGNCWQTCIASILGLPLAAVPHFVQEHESYRAVENATRAWAAERGYVMIGVGTLWLEANPTAVVMLEGVSPRGVAHVVVGRGIDTIHDPHPSRAGLSTITGGFLFASSDPLPAAPSTPGDGQPGDAFEPDLDLVYDAETDTYSPPPSPGTGEGAGS